MKETKHAHIIYVNYLTPDGKEMSVGGIQTYISNLVPLLEERGYRVTIYQKSSQPFEREMGALIVKGIPTKQVRGPKVGAALFKDCEEHFDRDKDLLIFGCDNYICDTKGIPFIAVQHGITWDKPIYSRPTYWLFKKFYRAVDTVRRVEKADMLVCVDNNFINWYRATVAKPTIRLIGIPNFSSIAPVMFKDDNGPVRIIFARRFFDYRGTRIFGEAVSRLIEEGADIHVTLAGEGPDEAWLRVKIGANPNVEFTRYASDESLAVHADKHIAVVPTKGSEGTSLSLLEAMSAQCAVIGTNVGGITDIIIDRYNGRLVSPDADSLYKALKELVEDKELRKRLAAKGYDTVKEAFSKEKWQGAWREVFSEFERFKDKKHSENK